MINYLCLMCCFRLFDPIEDFFTATIIGFAALLNRLAETTAYLAALLGKLAARLFTWLRRQQQGNDDAHDDTDQNAQPYACLCAPGTLLSITHNQFSAPFHDLFVVSADIPHPTDGTGLAPDLPASGVWIGNSPAR